MLRLMSYNIRFGGVGREERIAAVIRRAAPDLVVLQEATRPGVVEQLAELTGLAHFASRRGQSVAFLSREEARHHEWHYLPGLQRAVMEISVAGLRVYGVHLRATHSNYTERLRMREVRSLLTSLKARGPGFHLLAGDFNTLAPGELLDMQKLPLRYRLLAMVLGGRITYRAIQIMLDAGYVDCYRRLHTDPGFTFPAWEPHVRLDYVFAPQEHAWRVTRCEVMTGIKEPAKATDHLPLLAEVDLGDD